MPGLPVLVRPVPEAGVNNGHMVLKGRGAHTREPGGVHTRDGGVRGEKRKKRKRKEKSVAGTQRLRVLQPAGWRFQGPHGHSWLTKVVVCPAIGREALFSFFPFFFPSIPLPRRA